MPQVQTQQLKFSTGAVTAITNVSTEAVRMWNDKLTVHASIAGTGTVSVTANVEGSNNGGTTWSLLTALSLTGTNADSKSYTVDGPWGSVRVTLASITGTGATAQVWVGGTV